MSEEFQAWKNHFIDQAKGLIPYQKKFYKVSMQQGGGTQPQIKMVSPTEQIVERAKASLQPPSVYDPVTGVMQQTKGKHIPTSYKRKRKISKKRNQKKISRKKKMKTKTKKQKKKRKPKWT
jgi:hypothetical protein